MDPSASCSPCSSGSCSLSSSASGSSGLADCAPLAFVPDGVDKIAKRLVKAGADEEAVLLGVLETIYPATPDGRAIRWASLGPSDAACLRNLAQRVYARVRLQIALQADKAAARVWASVGGRDA